MKFGGLFYAIILVAVSACGSSTDEGNSDTIDPGTLDTEESTDTNPINTVFNGFMLSEVTSQSERLLSSTTFYRYNSDQNTITVYNASGVDASFEDADISRTIELDSDGLPQKITRFNDDRIVLIDNYSFNPDGRLNTRDFEFPLTGDRPRRNIYLDNANGQLTAEITVDTATGIELSRTEYSYSNNGILVSADSVGISITNFNSDQLNRVSGWTETNPLIDAVTTASYTYDTNNNITEVEIIDSSGILSRTTSYSYIEVSEPIYNLVWYDYLYSPRIP